MGPRSRELLARLTRADLGHDAFPFATMQEIEIGHAVAREIRMTYVGEMGWELYVPNDFAASDYEAVVAAGGATGTREDAYSDREAPRSAKDLQDRTNAQ